MTKKYRVGMTLYFDADDKADAIKQFMDELTNDFLPGDDTWIDTWVNVVEEVTDAEAEAMGWRS